MTIQNAVYQAICKIEKDYGSGAFFFAGQIVDELWNVKRITASQARAALYRLEDQGLINRTDIRGTWSKPFEYRAK